MEYTFIKTDPEEIISQIIAEYQKETKEELNPADAERIIIDCMAYREMLLRGEMEHLMSQNFVQYASGKHLDNWGALFGVVRSTGESDDDYRARILNSNHSSIGTLNAYINCVLSVENVADVLLQRKCDDNTLAPGMIRIIPLMKYADNNMIVHGTAHDEVLESVINGVLYNDDFGVIGAYFEYNSAVAVPINGSVAVSVTIGYDKERVKIAMESKIVKYFANLSLKFNNEFDIHELEREILQVSGVMSVNNIVFSNVPVKDAGEYYVKGVVNVEIY